MSSAPAPTVVHSENKWRLLRYRGRGDGTPVVMVPSLINRHYILDLLPHRSFARHVAASGRDVFLIDWGTPRDEDRHLTFDAVCDRFIGRAMRVACRESSSAQAHLLGYCMGGTLAAIHAAVRPERVASLCAIAAPVAFREAGIMSRWVTTRSFDVGALVRATGLVPWPLLQAAFHLIRPTSTVGKLVRFADRRREAGFAEAFFALERWGTDNVSLPGAFFERYIEELYRGDALMRGNLRVADRHVLLEEIECPVCVVSFGADPIVPAASATPLLNAVGTRDVLHVEGKGGHVSGLVSRRGAAELWPRLTKWWSVEVSRCMLRPHSRAGKHDETVGKTPVGRCADSRLHPGLR